MGLKKMNKEAQNVVEEQLTTSDMLKDASIIMTEASKAIANTRATLAKRTDRNSKRMLREADSSLAVSDMIKNNTIDLSIILERQPKKEDFKFPKRYTILLAEAQKRMSKSSFMFPSPKSVANAFIELLPDGTPKDEMLLRISHFLARCDLVRSGTLVSSICRRLIQGAYVKEMLSRNPEMVLPKEQTDLMVSCLAAVAAFVNKVK